MKELQRQLGDEEEEIVAMGRQFRAEHEAMLDEVINSLREVKEQEGLSLADLQQRIGLDRAQWSENRGPLQLQALHRYRGSPPVSSTRVTNSSSLAG